MIMAQYSLEARIIHLNCCLRFDYDKILKKPKMMILWPPNLAIWVLSGSETRCTSLTRPHLLSASIRSKKASVWPIFWNYPKPQFLVPKALTHQNISKFLVTEICHASRVLGANVVNRGFEGCGFDFWHFFRFWKKLLEKHLFRPGKMTRSPGGCSCGSTFKNIHFSKKIPKTPRRD